jgi:hypothetical protein
MTTAAARAMPRALRYVLKILPVGRAFRAEGSGIAGGKPNFRELEKSRSGKNFVQFGACTDPAQKPQKTGMSNAAMTPTPRLSGMPSRM